MSRQEHRLTILEGKRQIKEVEPDWKKKMRLIQNFFHSEKSAPFGIQEVPHEEGRIQLYQIGGQLSQKEPFSAAITTRFSRRDLPDVVFIDPLSELLPEGQETVQRAEEKGISVVRTLAVDGLPEKLFEEGGKISPYWEAMVVHVLRYYNNRDDILAPYFQRMVGVSKSEAFARNVIDSVVFKLTDISLREGAEKEWNEIIENRVSDVVWEQINGLAEFVFGREVVVVAGDLAVPFGDKTFDESVPLLADEGDTGKLTPDVVERIDGIFDALKKDLPKNILPFKKNNI